MRIYSNKWCDHKGNVTFGTAGRMYVVRGFRGRKGCVVKCPKCGKTKLHCLKYPLRRDVKER